MLVHTEDGNAPGHPARDRGGSARADRDRTWSVSFSRWFPLTPDALWRAVTDPSSVRRWLGVRTGGIGVGAGYRLELGPVRVVRGTVLESSPPRRLVATWVSGDGYPGEVVFDIEAAGAGARLLFAHRRLEWRDVARCAADWHERLDRLGDVASGHGIRRIRPHRGRAGGTRRDAGREHWSPRAPREVWAVLTESHGLASWLGVPVIWPGDARDGSGGLAAGDRFAVVPGAETDPHVTVEVVRLRPLRQYWFVWDVERRPLTVRISLRPDNGGTVIRLGTGATSRGGVGGGGPGWGRLFTAIDGGPVPDGGRFPARALGGFL